MFRCVAEDVEFTEWNRFFPTPSSSLSHPRPCAMRKRLPSPQPNDLWRFFSSDGPPSTEKSSQANGSFVDRLLHFDGSSSSHVQEVMDVMKLYEDATASWGKIERPSRKWFPPPETPFDMQTLPTEEKKGGPLTKPRPPCKTKEELLEQIPTWRVSSAAVYLNRASKEALLEKCTPKLSRVSADHMSLLHHPNATSLLKIPLGKTVKLLAYGEKCGVVAQQVALKGPHELCSHKAHPHVTISFAERVLKKDIAAMKGKGSFEKWVFPIPLEGVVGIKMDNGKVLFSDEEFYVETGVELNVLRHFVEQSEIEETIDKDMIELDLSSQPSPLEELSSDARPSDEIQRLLAQDSFSSRHDTPVYQDHRHNQNTTSHKAAVERRPEIEKTESASACRGMLHLSDERVLEHKVLHVGGKISQRSLEISSSRSPIDQRHHQQQDFKKQQAELRIESEKHRQASWKEQKRGEEFLEKARAAYREGHREMGDEYNRVSTEATLLHREHTDKAERLAFEASNLGRVNTHTIDLHHLHLQEAISRLKKVTNGLKSFVEDVKTMYRLKIITGKGINSVDNIPVLRPAVLEFLKSDGLCAEIDDNNQGVILAYIHPSAH